MLSSHQCPLLSPQFISDIPGLTSWPRIGNLKSRSAALVAHLASTSNMAPQPTLNTEIYDAISPKNFLGQFKDNLVVVTGAGRGIGRHIALSFARAGATLALLDFDTARQEETKSLCEKEGSKVYTYGCDVTQYEQCKQVVKEIEKLGEIDVLVNNAGGGPIRGFTSQKFEEFWAGVEQNFKGVCQSTYVAGINGRL